MHWSARNDTQCAGGGLETLWQRKWIAGVSEDDGCFKRDHQPSLPKQRKIIDVDMDAFYAPSSSATPAIKPESAVSGPRSPQ